MTSNSYKVATGRPGDFSNKVPQYNLAGSQKKVVSIEGREEQEEEVDLEDSAEHDLDQCTMIGGILKPKLLKSLLKSGKSCEDLVMGYNISANGFNLLRASQDSSAINVLDKLEITKKKNTLTFDYINFNRVSGISPLDTSKPVPGQGEKPSMKSYCPPQHKIETYMEKGDAIFLLKTPKCDFEKILTAIKHDLTSPVFPLDYEGLPKVYWVPTMNKGDQTENVLELRISQKDIELYTSETERDEFYIDLKILLPNGDKNGVIKISDKKNIDNPPRPASWATLIPSSKGGKSNPFHAIASGYFQESIDLNGPVYTSTWSSRYIYVQLFLRAPGKENSLTIEKAEIRTLEKAVKSAEDEFVN